MKVELIIAILSSSVIATGIGSLIAFFQSKKNDNLHYISEERTKWRAELRKIAEEIDAATIENLSGPLTKLKVRINAYGFLEKSSLEKDTLLWKLIEFHDIEATNQNNVKRFKELLIMSISLLLKMDWERYKYEVEGWKDDIIEKFLFGLACVSLLFNLLYILKADLFMFIILFVLFDCSLYDIRKKFENLSLNHFSIIEKEVIDNKENSKELNKVAKLKMYMMDKKDVFFLIIITLMSISLWSRWSYISVFGYICMVFLCVSTWILLWTKRTDTAREKTIYFAKCNSKIANEYEELLKTTKDGNRQ